MLEKQNKLWFQRTNSFRLLSELYSFLYMNKKEIILILKRFPSPIGVIFFLMDCVWYDDYRDEYVSVSYRSYILSYIKTCFRVLNKLQDLRVSVSYRSYILSYYERMFYLQKHFWKFPSPIGVIFFLIF